MRRRSKDLLSHKCKVRDSSAIIIWLDGSFSGSMEEDLVKDKLEINSEIGNVNVNCTSHWLS